jgi:nitroimidazol reductase NimA-like FMN-containing flavoprotein (pyridoxamine 5'-phosphate oxidase superfamily)
MRPMRRSDRAATQEKSWEILENAEFMTLSMMGAEGVPYGVTLSFARVENALYFHCANEGYKLDSLRKNPAVCVNAVYQQRTKAEEFTVAFESAVAFGTAFEVIDQEEKVRGLLAICKKYAPENPGAAAYIAQYPQVSVWRIDVREISGKIHD